jgi:two-component system sensor histidine kinase/response regulator
VVETQKSQGAKGLGRLETILVIEDEEIMRQACVDILTDQGYRVLTAENGTVGLDFTREHGPDLVLVDIRMPGIEGLEVLRLIEGIDPSIIKIVITGYATIEYAVASMKNGAYDFLPKPFTPEELRLIVSRGLERRRLVAEKEALVAEKKKMTEFFISIVSHQLQSPLSAVKQNFEVILGDMAGPVSVEARDIIVRADRRVDDLIALIQDWLSFARFDPTSVREEFTELNVAEMIGRRIESQAPIIEPSAVRVSLAADPDLPPVMGDERSLGEAFSNLINNGVKYNRRGGTLDITVKTEGPLCVVRFADNGIGIPDKDIPLIFSEFFRVKSKDTKEIKGTGLGLAIVKRIVEAHDGTIDFQTQYGRGTVFTVRLPIARPLQ